MCRLFAYANSAPKLRRHEVHSKILAFARCGLEVISGIDAIEEESEREARIKERNRIDPELRLACRVRPTGVMTVRATYW